MKPLPIQQVAHWCGGELVSGLGEMRIEGISTDTRTLQQGEVYLALKGDRFDGHDYLGQAAEAGAAGCIVDSGATGAEGAAGMACIRVEDTLQALQSLARSYRESLNIRVVGITGSNGKTSTKEMVAAVLGAHYTVQKTLGNLNNHIGVPLTLLGLEEDTQWAVVEMGMNHRGEIRPLAEMAAPDYGIITGIGWAHIEFFDSREDIAEEKGQLFRVLSDDAVAVFNGDDSFLKRVSKWTGARRVRCGFHEGCEFRLSALKADGEGIEFSVSHTEMGSSRIHLPLFGRPMARNAALAVAIGAEAGVSSEEAGLALRSLKLPGGRLKVMRFDGGWVVDDTYNASPDSVAAAMESLDLLPGSGRKGVLLGGMSELGKRSRDLHAWIGGQAVRAGVDYLLAVGPNVEATIEEAVNAGANPETFQVVGEHEAMWDLFRKVRGSGDRVLVKGSRAMKMETIIEYLKEEI